MGSQVAKLEQKRTANIRAHSDRNKIPVTKRRTKTWSPSLTRLWFGGTFIVARAKIFAKDLDTQIISRRFSNWNWYSNYWQNICSIVKYFYTHHPIPPLIRWCLQGLPSPLRQAFFYITNLDLTLKAFVLNPNYLLLVDGVFLGNPDTAIRMPFAGLDNFQIRHKRVGSLQAGLGSQRAIDFLN